jgi:hypothetical protein
MKNASNWFLRIAVVYFVIGVTLGLKMAASHDHSMAPLHAHINLLGWVSMTLFGLFYRVVPAAAQTTLAKLHAWGYLPGTFVQMVLLGALLSGHAAVEPALGVASVVVVLSIVCFAVNVWRNTRPAA